VTDRETDLTSDLASGRPEQLCCPICASSSRPYCDKPMHGHLCHMHRCGACGYGFISNRPSLQTLAEVYGSEDKSHLEWDVASINTQAHEQRKDCRAVVKRIASLTSERGTSLDVGCGDGAFSYHLAKKGFRPTMIDMDQRVQQAAALVPNSTFQVTSFEDFTDRSREMFSAVVMSQVLEHALDPLDWLKRTAALLSPTGVLAVAVPNFGGVYRLLGARDPFIIPPIHLNFFTPASLRLAFEKAGLTVLKVRSFNRISLNRGRGVKGAIKKAIEAGWNATSWITDGTARGIVLQVLGRRNA